MPAIDAAGECVLRSTAGWLGRRSARRASDRPLSLRRGDFAEHALRHRRDACQLSLARWARVLCWFSPLDSAVRNGVRTFAFMPGRAGGWASDLWATEHAGGGLLCDPCWAWRRFRDPDFRPLSTGADRRRGLSAIDRHFGGEAR